MAKALLYEPDPRKRSYSAVVNGELYVWGGKKKATTSLQVYHPCLESWRQLFTRGPPPPGLYSGASAHSQHYLYLYGGMKAGGSFSGCLHRLNTNTATWTELSGHCPGAPMKKAGCGMIVYENSVIIIGGGGIRNGPIQPGSEWKKLEATDDDNDPNTQGYTNEMHKYDLREGTWSSLKCTGTRPPVCVSSSLIMINNHQAVLFGGMYGNNDPFILDLVGMNWSEIPSDGGECPVWRGAHAAVCMDYGGDKPHILVMGGQNIDSKILNDVWMMDIKSGRWRKVPVPNLQCRSLHCAAAFSLSPGITEVVLFGGSISGEEDDVIAETTILRFERDASDPQSEWRLTDVADNTQRGTSERIRKKMTKLSQLTHEAEGRAQEAKRGKEEAERRVQEADRRVQEAEMGKEEAESRVQAVQGEKLETEHRAQDLERRLAEMEIEERNSEEAKKHWLVERREIHMTSRKLGGGGWGEVMVAEFRGEQVAAKVLYKDLQSPYYHDIFEREMNMASRVRSPHLVQFIGASMDEEMVILMELMPTSLRQHLTSNAPATPSAAFRDSVSLDVAKALNYLHLMKPHPIIHRDISSANVLLEPLPNQRWRAKVTDYGSVNLQNQLRTENPGSPVYSAPEARIPSRQSTKMDIFSYGVLLVEMCTARFPDVDRRAAMIRSIRERHWVDLIERCLQQDPSQRPTASQLITQFTARQ